MHWEKVNPQVKARLQNYLKELLNLHQDNILSINLYGSAASGEFSPKTSDINILVILKEINLDTLKKSLKTISRGLKKKIPAPLFLTREHIKTSLDTFPIEFVEMKENHLCLWGEDILKEIEVSFKNLRFVCEQQLKGKLIHIREIYLEVGLKRKGIEAILKNSLRSLLAVFKSCLRLKNINPSLNKEEMLKQLGETFNIETSAFIEILKDTRNDEKIAGENVEVFLEKYLKAIEKLASQIDKLEEENNM